MHYSWSSSAVNFFISERLQVEIDYCSFGSIFRFTADKLWYPHHVVEVGHVDVDVSVEAKVDLRRTRPQIGP